MAAKRVHKLDHIAIGKFIDHHSACLNKRLNLQMMIYIGLQPLSIILLWGNFLFVGHLWKLFESLFKFSLRIVFTIGLLDDPHILIRLNSEEDYLMHLVGCVTLIDI